MSKHANDPVGQITIHNHEIRKLPEWYEARMMRAAELRSEAKRLESEAQYIEDVARSVRGEFPEPFANEMRNHNDRS